MGTIQTQVDDLMAQMTPAEKAGQLTQYFYFRLPPGTVPALGFDADEQPVMVEAALREGTAGSLLFLTDPAEINRLQRLAIEGNRLGIPALVGFDVIHGLRTIFPVPIAMAASWDPETIERGQAVAAREARAVGIHWAFAPMVDIARDPRWGRIIEGAGEDPYLGAAVAVAQVRGFQGDQLGAPEHVIAGPKHLVGYGAALGGRDYDEVNLSDSELWNVYLPPFKAAVEAGAGNIMTAYMDSTASLPRQVGGCSPRSCATSGDSTVSWSVTPMSFGTLSPTSSPTTLKTRPLVRSTPASTWRWPSPGPLTQTCP
jgi:beta-glucosidase